MSLNDRKEEQRVTLAGAESPRHVEARAVGEEARDMQGGSCMKLYDCVRCLRKGLEAMTVLYCVDCGSGEDETKRLHPSTSFIVCLSFPRGPASFQAPRLERELGGRGVIRTWRRRRGGRDQGSWLR